MTLEIGIENYRGVKEFSATAPEYSLVSINGDNAVGKTSVLEGLVACLRGNTNMLGLPANQSGQYAYRDRKQGERSVARVHLGGAHCELDFDKKSIDGSLAFANEMSDSVASTLNGKPAERWKYLSPLIGADVPYEAFRKAWIEAGLANDENVDAAIAKRWKQIAGNDAQWDLQSKNEANGLLERKREFTNTTGEQFGTTKLASYRPDHWTDAIDTTPLGELEDEKSRTALRLSEMKSQAETAKLVQEQIAKATSNNREEIEKKIDDLIAISIGAQQENDAYSTAEIDAQISGLQEKINEGTAKLRSGAGSATRRYSDPANADRWLYLQPTNQDREDGLEESGGKGEELYKNSAKAASDRKPLTDAIAEMQKEERLCKDTRQDIISEKKRLSEQAINADQSITALKKSLADIEGLANTHIPDCASEADIAQAERDAQLALRNLTAKKKMDEIVDLRERWRRQEAICHIYSPKGLRSKVSANAVAMVQERIASVCKCGGKGFPYIQIALDEGKLSVQQDGVDYALLSGSERWRAGFAITIAVAMLRKSQIVCLDGLDINDEYNKREVELSCMKVLRTARNNEQAELRWIVMTNTDSSGELSASVEVA